VVGEAVSVLQLEDAGTTLLDRHGQHHAVLSRRGRDRRAEVLVDQDARPARSLDRDVTEALVDE